jgi:hypothetical protein
VRRPVRGGNEFSSAPAAGHQEAGQPVIGQDRVSPAVHAFRSRNIARILTPTDDEAEIIR